MSATTFSPERATSAPGLVPARIARWALPLLIVAAAVLLQCALGLDSDVSWLITVADHMVAGQRLYVDIVETNPPASVLLYLPSVALARALGIAPEPVVAASLFGFAALTIGLAARLLDRGGLLSERLRLPLLSASLFVFLLFPSACFAQREHFAVLALLPAMALAAVRAEGRAVSPRIAIIAGLGAGMTMAIKPHFVLAVAPTILFAAWRGRNWRTLFAPECWAAAAVVLAYAASLALLFPVYAREIVPVLREVYVPARAPWPKVWFSVVILLQVSATVLTLWLTKARIVRSRAALPLLAATGFGIALILQGKGYLNHGLPGDTLALLALAIAIGEQQGDAGQRRFVTGGFALLSAIGLWFFAHIFQYVGLADLVRRAAPPHPRIMLAGGDLGVGHPLTRDLGGVWVGRSPSLWLTGDVEYLLSDPPHRYTGADRAHLRVLEARETRDFVEDLRNGSPDVVLVDGVLGRRWIDHHPTVSSALADYRPAGTATEVTVLVRRRPGR